MLLILLIALASTPTPEPILSACARAESLAKAVSAEAAVVFDSTTVEVELNGRSHVHRHRIVKFIGITAARDARVQRVDYDPRANDHRIIAAVLHRADSTSHPIAVNGCADVEAPADGIYWGARMRLYDMGMVRPGDAMELWTYRIGYQIAYLAGDGAVPTFIPPQEGEFYDVVVFGEDRPMLEKTYRLLMPRSKPVQFAEYNGGLKDALRFRGDHLAYEWAARDLPAIKPEPFSAEASDFLPKVVLSTLEDWPARARWFHRTNEDQFAGTEAIAAMTQEVIRGLVRDEDRFLALQQWVATHIRYSGLSMGEGEGYTLHPADMIFTERSGVCKDMAGMLIAMLRSAGYETYPVMTMAGARVEDVPADQFNHCVVAVRRTDGSFFMLDPTWCAYSVSHWSRAEGHQHYVIGSPEGGSLQQQPLFEEDNRVAWRMKCSISAEGDLSGEFSIEPSGNYDTTYRRQLAYRTPAERDALFATYLKGLGSSVRITGVKHSDPDDLWSPFRLTVQFEAPGYAVAGEAGLVFAPPLLAVLTGGNKPLALCRYAREGSRDNPALIWSTRWEEATEDLRLPRGYAVVTPDSSVSFSRPPVSLEAAWKARGRAVSTALDARIADRYLNANEFAGIAEAAARVEALAARTVICRREGKR